MPYKDTEKQRAWKAAHAEEQRAYLAVWRAAHAEEGKAYGAVWRRDHAEEGKAYGAVWRRDHAEERKAYDKAYRVAHPEIHQARNARRRARKRNAPISDFTAQQWRGMQEFYNHRCVYCKKRRKGKLTQDHIHPLSKGGSHTLGNIVPACKSCNSRKQAGPVLVPVQPLLLIGDIIK